MDIHESLCCKKSARRKKRLVKTDRDKQLIRLDKRHGKLWEQKQLLPKVPLESPYQRGWKRHFALQDEIRRSPVGDFYEGLLTKINTFEYHYDRSFKRKKRHKGRNVYVVKQQLLHEFSDYSWQINRMKLTEEEKACFTRVDFINTHRRPDAKYVVTETWRYVLKIVPHMVTHIKLMDVDMERELSYINNHINNNHLWHRINRLTKGRSYRRKDAYNERPKYINTIKNMPRNSPKEAFLELET